MSEGWKSHSRKVTPYVPGEQPKSQNLIKLNTNENPYPPSPKVEACLRNIDVSRLRLYPDPQATELTAALSNYYGVECEQVFVGNGSDEVLALAFLAFFNGDKEILFPNITYSFYDVYAELYDIKHRKVPLNEQFEIDINAYKVENGGIIFSNPNAPTSIAISVEQIEDILKANRDVVVIVDEAYVDFGAESAVDLIHQYHNLLVIHTYSKSRALAGLRLGVAIGSKELIAHLEAVKNSFNSYPIDMIAQELATVAIQDVEYFKRITSKVIQTRTYVMTELRKLGFTVADSKTNFVFVTHPTLLAKDLFEFLKTYQIYVRYFDKPFIDNHLRISIGTDEEMDQLLKHIRMYMTRQ